MPGKSIEVKAGTRFGRLVVIGELDKVFTPNGTPNRMIECQCDCGVVGEYRLGSLRSGNTKSCGCFLRESASARATVHGLSKTTEFKAWGGMLDRCRNPNTKGYARYGGRGIRVCARWRQSFVAFLEDMGSRPSRRHSIDRIDNDGDYEPGNCRWATRKEQMRNTRANVMVEHEGETLCLVEWAERCGISPARLWRRLHAGWSVKAALSGERSWSETSFFSTPISKRDAAWYQEYDLRAAESAE